LNGYDGHEIAARRQQPQGEGQCHAQRRNALDHLQFSWRWRVSEPQLSAKHNQDFDADDDREHGPHAPPRLDEVARESSYDLR
jgi:hypothetical protein